jgi:hypothetical protein
MLTVEESAPHAVTGMPGYTARDTSRLVCSGACPQSYQRSSAVVSTADITCPGVQERA